jgi:hypothetical protein
MQATKWILLGIVAAIIAGLIGGIFGAMNGFMVQISLCKSTDSACLLIHYGYIALGLIIIGVGVDVVSHFIKRPTIMRLIKMRQAGVELRNKGMRLSSENEVPEWISSYEKWDTEMLMRLGRLDKEKAEWLRTLGTLPPSLMSYPYTYSDKHLLYLRVFTEKLDRLDTILRKYLDLPQQKSPA